MAMTALDDLAARLDTLEQRAINVDDLPLAALRRSLETNWQPEAGTLLADNSVTRASMSQKFVYGAVTMTWPGGSPSATDAVVTHGLDVTPIGVIAGCANNGPVFSVTTVSAFATATFVLSAKTFDGSSPAAATAQTFYWFAFA